jgi:hypothetical protein
VFGEFGFEGREEFAALVVDRAHAVEVVIVFGDFEHALARDVFASEHIFKEGNNVVVFFGASEGDEEEGVVLFRH